MKNENIQKMVYAIIRETLEDKIVWYIDEEYVYVTSNEAVSLTITDSRSPYDDDGETDDYVYVTLQYNDRFVSVDNLIGQEALILLLDAVISKAIKKQKTKKKYIKNKEDALMSFISGAI